MVSTCSGVWYADIRGYVLGEVGDGRGAEAERCALRNVACAYGSEQTGGQVLWATVGARPHRTSVQKVDIPTQQYRCVGDGLPHTMQ